MQTCEESLDIMDDQKINAPGSSRILYNVLCKVCHDHSSGKHYGIYACDGCAGFFKRSIRRGRQYVCKSQLKQGQCTVDKTHRNQCRACRLRKCFEAGMNKDSVQHERGPRNSTLRRQMSLYKDVVLGEAPEFSSMLAAGFPPLPMPLGMPMPMPPMHPHHPPTHPHPAFVNPFQPATMILDLSVPRVPHHAAMAPFYAANPNFINIRGLPPTPPLMAAENLKETAAEYLFKSITWLKKVQAFIDLPMTDQLHLLEESWKESFILTLAQYLMPINLQQLVMLYESDNVNSEAVKVVRIETLYFQDVLNQLYNLNVDSSEYESLRIIALFRKPPANEDAVNNSMGNGNDSPHSSASAESNSLMAMTKICSLQEEARNTLRLYVERKHPTQPMRYQSLMGILSMMNRISGFTIEELFFRKTIRGLNLARLVCDLYTQGKI